LLADAFGKRLSALVADWVRVGYCQGNFNSDNCAAGGFTLDYGPFGFIDAFDPWYQPWTGGGRHFSFLNQPMAAERNFHSFCKALEPLLESHPEHLRLLGRTARGFAQVMQREMEQMWAGKLGLERYDAPLFEELTGLMTETSVDYTIFFRELSELPDVFDALKKSFYKSTVDEALLKRWERWFEAWSARVSANAVSQEAREALSREMKRVNPKYTLREWLLVPAYRKAAAGEYARIHEMQEVMTKPYDEQSKAVEENYYGLKPSELFEIAGISHVSCSS